MEPADQGKFPPFHRQSGRVAQFRTARQLFSLGIGTLLLIFFVMGSNCLTLRAQEQEPKEAQTITTRLGKVYTEARITKVEPSALTIQHASGVARIPFSELPDSMREAYDYDPKEAAAYESELQANVQAVIYRLETEAAEFEAAQERERLAEEAYEAALERGVWVIGRVKVQDGYLLVMPDEYLHGRKSSRKKQNTERFLSQFVARPLLPSTLEIYVRYREMPNIADCEEAVMFITPATPGIVRTNERTYRAFELMAHHSTSSLNQVK